MQSFYNDIFQLPSFTCQVQKVDESEMNRTTNVTEMRQETRIQYPLVATLIVLTVTLVAFMSWFGIKKYKKL